ncbi:TorF family putative porin, partial [Variovorax guangxiensis]
AGENSGSGLKGRNSGYLNLAFAQEVAPSLTLKAAVGYTRFASDIKDLGVPNYVDYAVGVSYDFGSGLALYGGVQGANKKGYFGDVNKARGIVMLSKTL